MFVNVTPVATGDVWIGYGVRSFHSVIGELISTAKTELVMTAYLLTSNEIVNDVRGALSRGVAVTIYLYDDERKITKTAAVRNIFKLQKDYPYLNICIIKNRVLHAKILVADGKKVLAGSANLTQPAMVSNYEMGFLIEDPTISGQIIALIQKMGDE
ncbi:MAG: phosphatidylserine/phosphatidylglycerophosphate/cardiolipin synthase family protein [Methanoregula sp.]